MTAERGGWLQRALLSLSLFIAILAILHFGRGVLLPLAFAMLISLALAPLTGLFERLGLRRVPAVLFVAGVVFGVIGWTGWLVTSQVADLAGRLPQYRETLMKRVDLLRGPTARLLGRAYDTVQELGQEVADPTGAPSASGAPKVEVVRTSSGPLEKLGGALGTVFGAAGRAAAVMILVAFLLIFQADLRDRLTHLAGTTRVNVNLRMVEEAASQISRYLLFQTAVNVAFGAAFAAGLFALGIPNAPLWGVLAALLKYIPYLGPGMALLLPFSLSLMVFEGWGRPLMVVGTFALLELVTNYAIEPLVYARGAGLSPLAIVLNALFWGWLWGAWGVILAVPIMSALVTLGRHLPRLRVLHLLFGRFPDLEPEFRLYHRLLAGDLEASLELVEEYGRGKTPEQLCDGLLIPAVALAEQNRFADPAEDGRSDAFLSAMKALLKELEVRADLRAEGPSPDLPAASVLIVPTADEADELCARMLARLLREHRLHPQVLEASLTTGDKGEQVEKLNPDILCLSALPPGTILQTRYLFKRIRSREPGRDILVGVWASKEEPGSISARLSGEERIPVVVTLEAAVAAIREKAASIVLGAQAGGTLRG